MIVKSFVTVAVVGGLAACGPRQSNGADTATGEARTLGHVDRLQPGLDAIVAPDAVFEVLSDGHEWTEGPVWVPALQSVLYSDIPRNAIYRWREGAGDSVWLTPSGYTGAAPRGGETGSNGLALDSQGRLVLAQHGDRRIARLEAPLSRPAPVFTTLTDRFDGKRYSSPNDLIIRRNGDVYFTDPPYGLEHGADDPAKELAVNGVYRLAADGSVALLVDDLSRPNGIAFSPNEEILYVANSDPAQPVIRAYQVAPDGSLRDGRVLFGSWGDGMDVDQQGNLYVTSGETGVLVLAPDGTHLGTLVTGERTSNCTFGDDGSTLYVTSDMYLVRIRLKAKGVGFRRDHAQAEAGDWTTLFDGRSFAGWRGVGLDSIPPGHWVIEDGAIRKVASGAVPTAPDGQPLEGGDLMTVGTYRNFELVLEWKVSPGANSGIKYNVSEELSTASPPVHAALGFEYQVLDDERHPDARNGPNRTAGALYDILPPVPDKPLKPVGSFNEARIVFHEGHGEHWLNGVKVLEFDLGSATFDSAYALSKYVPIEGFAQPRTGHIVLQDHGDDVWFRNIKIRELPP
jgi:gluconolactonase